jgi:hypothetical protein
MEQQNLIKYQQGQSYVCTDNDYLNELYKKAGQPGKPLKPENIRWIPFRNRWENGIPNQIGQSVFYQVEVDLSFNSSAHTIGGGVVTRTCGYLVSKVEAVYLSKLIS